MELIVTLVRLVYHDVTAEEARSSVSELLDKLDKEGVIEK